MKKQSERSIRKQLLYWLLVPLSILGILSAVATYFLAESYADEIYDDQLVNSSDSVVGRLRIKDGRVDVDMPPAVINLLRHNFKDKFYYQVISYEGKLIEGDSALPLPKELPDFETAQWGFSAVDGEPVRTVLTEVFVEESPSHRVYVQVAETLRSRKALANHILFNTALSQLVLISFGATAVWFGVTRGLSRLDLLRNAVAARSQNDLRPLDEDEAPTEVRPLVRSINGLLILLREDLEAKQRFVANAAHQLRTPLAGLKTYIGLLKKLDTNENAAEVLKQLDAGADRTTHLVNRLLALAKAEPDAAGQADHQVLDLNDIASEATSSLVVAAVEKNIDISFESAANRAYVLGDKGSLQELVINIVENAVLYTPVGGTVCVSVELGETVRLQVEDSGPGIPVEERERVFERFYRILGSGVSGSGLGLAIVSEIARSHNARVFIDSGQGGLGARVVVEFIKANSLSNIYNSAQDSETNPIRGA